MIIPRRLLRSPTTAPWNSSGVLDLDPHDWLLEAGAALLEGLDKGVSTGRAEGHFTGVYGVVGAIVQAHLAADDFVTCNRALLHSSLEALVDRWNIFTGDTTTGDVVFEFVGIFRIFGQGNQTTDHVTVLDRNHRFVSCAYS